MEWKKKVINHWEDLKVVSMKIPDLLNGTLEKGKTYRLEMVIETGNLSASDIGLEIVLMGLKKDGEH